LGSTSAGISYLNSDGSTISVSQMACLIVVPDDINPLFPDKKKRINIAFM